MQKDSQIKAIGIVSIIYGSLWVLLSSLLIFYIIVISNVFGNGITDPFLFATFIILFYSYSLLFIISGIGLLKHKNWARKILIILSIISLFEFPIGTAIGIWFLIVLFNEKVKASMK